MSITRRGFLATVAAIVAGKGAFMSGSCLPTNVPPALRYYDVAYDDLGRPIQFDRMGTRLVIGRPPAHGGE